MLGRQQIEGASTAISELFKNAHDAYADHVRVDLLREDGLLIIQDDGIGMTKNDFENKWLVLGTESKVNANAKSAYRPKGKSIRPVMGEKGIGRLAIAILGSQALVLTRAERNSKVHDLVACHIHWGLFELPEVNLEDIDLPIQTYQNGTIPSKEDVAELVEQTVGKLGGLAKKYKSQSDSIEAIQEELKQFAPDPVELEQLLGDFSLGQNSGTHFIIQANKIIEDEIDQEKKDDLSKEFTKFLVGFCNQTFCNPPRPAIATSFRDWKAELVKDELIEPSEFFTVSELENADHLVSGKVDENGQFEGTIRVFEKVNSQHVIPWKERKGEPTLCGPFEIEFASIQGKQTESKLDAESWARMNAKLAQIGGLYVYRDQIRILPYGIPDFDWLKIEERRSKHASYYFFSHRRMFGAVLLTRTKNSGLHEKAGREGFQKEKAYRQFRSIIENLLIQLAADFFRDNEGFATQKEHYESLEKAKREREKIVKEERKQFKAGLADFFAHSDEGTIRAEAEAVRESVTTELAEAAKLAPSKAVEKALAVEQSANRQLDAIRDRYTVRKPAGIGLGKSLLEDWSTYQASFEQLKLDLFDPLQNQFASEVAKLATNKKLVLDQNKRISVLLREGLKEQESKLQENAETIAGSGKKALAAANSICDQGIAELRRVMAEVEAELAEKTAEELPPNQVEEFRNRLEDKVNTVAGTQAEKLEKIRDLFIGLSENLESGASVNQLDMIEAIETDLETLKDESEVNSELVQQGLAIAVINHEFHTTIKQIRQSIRELKTWADINEDLMPLYSDIRHNFEHLDGHLSLFTPLQRRLYRQKIEVTGGDLNHYIRELFGNRFSRHDVNLKVSQAFLDTRVLTYPSALYPVFINLIDNAIFWLNSMKSDKGISLDSDEATCYLLCNNGPEIAERDLEAIFEQGFSRKPGGRGLGLFISRRSLRKEGMDLLIEQPKSKDNQVVFKILWPEDNE